MNENLDLTKTLEGCPKGTEFHSSSYGKIIFEGITCNPNDNFPIEFRDCKGGYVFLPKSGKYDYENAECIVFPSKDQRDWSKFERFWDKPKVEKFDPKTLQPFDKILVRNSNWNSWVCDLFSHIKTNKPCLPCFYPIVGLSWDSEYCVPYNDETKHLVGTPNDCPDYYKWWEE